MQIFYNRLNQPMKISMDAAFKGAFMGNSINEAKQLLEDMALNDYHWASRRGFPKKEERHEVDAFIMLASKVEALFQMSD